MDANVAALLQFVLILHTRQFVVQVEPMIFLDIPPIYHQFRVEFLNTSLLHAIMLSRSESML